MAPCLDPERNDAGDSAECRSRPGSGMARASCWTTRRTHAAGMRHLAPVSLLVLSCLMGCRLVDQTTFGGKPQKPPPDMLTQALQPGPAVPLVTIVFNGGEVAYTDQLRLAVQMAEARKPDVQYDVVTVVPASGTPADQVAAARAGESDAVDVATEMNELGVDPPRIHMAARTDPNVNARELRIYVR